MGMVAFTATVGLWKLLPLVASVLACIAFWLIVERLRASVTIALFFCVPTVIVAIIQAIPIFVVAGNSPLYNLGSWISPLLALFPAFALWKLSTEIRS